MSPPDAPGAGLGGHEPAGVAGAGLGAHEPAGVAAFDFDGTLVGGDSLMSFLALLHGRRGAGRLLALAAPAMTAAYRTRGRDGAKLALLRRALSGLPAEWVAEVGEGYGHRLATQLRPTMAERLGWHRERGHRLVLVSASLATYLNPFGRLLGLDEVIATQLEEGPDGLLTGRLVGPNVRGAEKATRLAAALATWADADRKIEMWAYGDSAGDREMLAMSDHPLLVGGRRRRGTHVT